MLTFSSEQNEEYVIFGLAPDRYAEVAKKVNTFPHKWVIGSYEDQLELSCLMKFKDFKPNAKFLGKGEMCYLKLGPANPRFGSRPAYYNFWDDEDKPIGRFKQVAQKPPYGEPFTFDPETGNFFAVEDQRNA